MNTTAPQNTTTYNFTTCKRCGYIIATEEEICEDCKNQQENNSKIALW
jgi:RNA polymerase subunit RPABC4/transcription elongation factor Spt4